MLSQPYIIITYKEASTKLVLRTRGGLQRNQCSCHLRGLPHDPARQGALADKQDI